MCATNANPSQIFGQSHPGALKMLNVDPDNQPGRVLIDYGVVNN